MEKQDIPLREVLAIAFNFKLDTDAQVSLSQAVELVLKSKIKTKKTVIETLLVKFGTNQPHLAC